MPTTVLSRDDHPISRTMISPRALTVLYRLQDKGFTAYLAGGCVRDLLLGKEPKDFDVVTDATPNQVKRAFRNCRLIGRRFRLAHVYFHDEVIEVATFRSNETEEVGKKRQENEDGVVTRDNVFGSPEQDALRRDFTVNALFYNIADFSIIDHAEGLPDLEARLMRCIGDPDERYIEDPVRMIRAIRFAATLDLNIEEDAWEAIVRNRDHLATASNARLYEEMLKFFYSGAAARAFELLEESGLLKVLMPTFGHWLEQASEADRRWTWRALRLMDQCKKSELKEPPALLWSLLFGAYHEARAQEDIERGVPYFEAMETAMRTHQQGLVERIRIPMRDMQHMLSITRMQPRFRDHRPQSAAKLMKREGFREAWTWFKFYARTRDLHDDEVLWWDDMLRKQHGKHKRRPAKETPQEEESAPAPVESDSE